MRIVLLGCAVLLLAPLGIAVAQTLPDAAPTRVPEPPLDALVRADSSTLVLTLPALSGAPSKLLLHGFEFNGDAVATDKLHLRQLSPGVFEITSVAYDIGEWRLRLNDAASYYGLGERSDTLNHAHTVVHNLAQTTSGPKGASTSKPVPFFMSTTGYGVWFDTTRDATFDLNATSSTDIVVDCNAEKLRVVLFTGPEFPKILAAFTALVGRADLPSYAAFAPWRGDKHAASFSPENGLPTAVTAGLNAGMSGIPLWTSDLAGDFTAASPDSRLFIRAAEYAAFSSAVETASPSGDSAAEALAVYRKFSVLNMALFPYRYAAVQQAVKTGMPIMRALVLQYQDDEKARQARYEYLFGPDMLVAPIVDEGTQRTVYLPAGEWLDYWTGAALKGGQTIVAEAAVDSVPVYVRQGAVVPMLPDDVVTLKTMGDRRVYELFGDAVPATATTADFEGRVLTRAGNSLTITGDSAAHVILRWRFQRVEAATVDGEAVELESDAKGAFIEFDHLKRSAIVWR